MWQLAPRAGVAWMHAREWDSGGVVAAVAVRDKMEKEKKKRKENLSKCFVELSG